MARILLTVRVHLPLAISSDSTRFAEDRVHATLLTHSMHQELVEEVQESKLRQLSEMKRLLSSSVQKIQNAYRGSDYPFAATTHSTT